MEKGGIIRKLLGASLVAQKVKNLPVIKRHGFNSWVRKIPWGRKWHSLRYSCLENPRDGGAWWATAHGVAEADMTEPVTLSLPRGAFKDNGYHPCLDCSDSVLGQTSVKFTILYVLNMCSLLYVNCTLIKLLKCFPGW